MKLLKHKSKDYGKLDTEMCSNVYNAKDFHCRIWDSWILSHFVINGKGYLWKNRLLYETLYWVKCTYKLLTEHVQYRRCTINFWMPIHHFDAFLQLLKSPSPWSISCDHNHCSDSQVSLISNTEIRYLDISSTLFLEIQNAFRTVSTF